VENPTACILSTDMIATSLASDDIGLDKKVGYCLARTCGNIARVSSMILNKPNIKFGMTHP